LQISLPENLEPLFAFSKVKNYPARIGGLAEILDWSQEFCEQFYDALVNWDGFKRSSDNNIYTATSLDELIMVFGQDKMKKFDARNLNHDTYFLEKYSATKYDYEE
jgi:hypothetical protein